MSIFTNAHARIAASGVLALAMVAGAGCSDDSVVTDVTATDSIPLLTPNLGTTEAVLPSGAALVAEDPANTSGPDSVVLEFSGLPVLSSGSYGVWLFDPADSSFAAVNGSFLADSQTTQGGTFNASADGNVVMTLESSTAPDWTAFGGLVVTVESSASPSSPSNARVLSTGDGESMTFGARNPADPTGYILQGTGDAMLTPDSLIILLDGVSDAPSGFHYRSYVLAEDADTIASSLRLDVVTVDEFGNTEVRIGASEFGGFAEGEKYVLSLEPDGQTVSVPTIWIQVSENWAEKYADHLQPPEEE